MATFNIPYTFVNGTTIIADEHNDNWVGIKAFAEGISAGTNIDGNAITTTKIADNAVIDTKIASSAVTNAKIATNAVTDTKILDGAVTTAKINALAVIDTKIAAGAVTETKIGTGAVVEAKIGTGAVTNAKIGLLAVDAARIANNTITNTQIAAGANIDYSKLNLAGQLLIGDFGSAAKPVIICTSTTRPTTGVVAGQMIWETDKNRLLVAITSTPTWQLLAGELFAIGSRTAGLAIANSTTSTLTYSAETDPDNLLSSTTFTAPYTGMYACIINVTSAGNMSAGFGSTLVLTGEGWGNPLFGTEMTICLTAPMTAGQTQTWTITNGTGASLTYVYTATFRHIGQ